MVKKTFRQLINERQILVPGVFDCISARAVELVGFEGAYLSSEGVAYSRFGMPDIGMVNENEMMWVASRISDYIPMPLMVSIENGYSLSPLGTYHAVKRMKKGGIDSFIIDDTGDLRGCDRGTVEIVAINSWLSKIKAAVEASEGTDTLIIARTWVKDKEGTEAAIRRCKAAENTGASMVAIVGLKTEEEAELLAKDICVPKLWNNMETVDGKPVVNIKVLNKLGFPLVIIRYTEKAAMFGMLDFAKQNNRRGDTVYHDQHDFDGILKPGQDYHELFSFHKKWIPMEQKFMEVEELAKRSCVVKKEEVL